MNLAATTIQEDSKRARILEGAMSVFLAYGFQRTTMDDIARTAQISRPALYLVFRNKTDIYRALAKDFMEECTAQARVALSEDKPLAERLEASVSCVFDMLLEVEQSPHGAEILDMKGSLASDIVAAGRRTMSQLLERAIGAEAERLDAEFAGRGLSPAVLGDMLLDAIDGLKMRGVSGQELRLATRQYIQIIVGALRG
jgi:AcrR family transcriptional regulator